MVYAACAMQGPFTDNQWSSSGTLNSLRKGCHAGIRSPVMRAEDRTVEPALYFPIGCGSALKPSHAAPITALMGRVSEAGT
jgi:hypothetical protein